MNVLTLAFILVTFQLHIVVSQVEFFKLFTTLLSFPQPQSTADVDDGVRTVERSISSGICSIDIKTGLNKTANGAVKEPLFLKYKGNAYHLMIPDHNGDLQFKSGESALIACTSDQKPNHLTFSEY